MVFPPFMKFFPKTQNFDCIVDGFLDNEQIIKLVKLNIPKGVYKLIGASGNFEGKGKSKDFKTISWEKLNGECQDRMYEGCER